MRLFRLFLIASLAVAALLLPSLASADGITWTLSSLPLSDGGSLSGTFNYDASSNTYSAIDLTSTAGSLLGGTLYTTLTPPFFSNTTFLGLGPATIPGSFANLTFLELYFNNSLTNAGGTDPAYAIEIFCANSTCSNYVERCSPTGTVIGRPVSTPEPSTLFLLASAFLALFLLGRRP